MKADTTSVASVVDTATKLATGAVSELKEMVTKVGEKADAAYTEANHVNIKIGDLNAALLRVAETTNGKEKP